MVDTLAELSELWRNTSCCWLYTSLHVMHVLSSLTSDCLPVCSVLAQLHLPNCMNETVLSVCVWHHRWSWYSWGDTEFWWYLLQTGVIWENKSHEILDVLVDLLIWFCVFVFAYFNLCSVSLQQAQLDTSWECHMVFMRKMKNTGLYGSAATILIFFV